MPKTQEKLAGEYELLADEFTRPEDSDEGKRGAYKRPKTNDPDAHVLVTYSKGDLVSLSDGEAARLLEGPRPAVAKPGAAEEAALNALNAQVEALQARKAQIESEAEARKSAAGNPQYDPRYATPRAGYAAQTADVEPLKEGVTALAAGNDESEPPPDPEEVKKSGDRPAVPAGTGGIAVRPPTGPAGPLTARTAEDAAKEAKKAAPAKKG